MPSWSWSDLDVAVPRRPSRLPGVRMAGFRQRTPAIWDISMIVHPSVTLLIDLSDGDGAHYRVPGGAQRGRVVIGLLPGELHATGLARVECLQIRLEPALAATVLGACGPVVSLADVWGCDAARIEERLHATASWDERFAIATDALTSRIGGGVDPEVAHAWNRARHTRGRLRVDDLAGEVGWSRKRLWSRFRAQLGITPKLAARLVRFDHAAHLLAAGHPPAAVAARCGYTDQSHLHREARTFAGLTPAGVAGAPWLAIDHVAWPRAISPGCAGSRATPDGR